MIEFIPLEWVKQAARVVGVECRSYTTRVERRSPERLLADALKLPSRINRESARFARAA